MKALMTHVVVGYPNMRECERLVLEMDKAGVEYIELQIPFSDPVADGPVIMAANQKALESGVSVADCFALMKRLSGKVKARLLFMSYYNILHSYGVSEFCKRAATCGCYGLIVPDIPFDQEPLEGYLASCARASLRPIQVISPLTSDARLRALANVAEGFVYCVSRYGTTGTSSSLNPRLREYLKRVRKFIDLPLAVGFGISSRAQLEAVWKEAEIAVMGSKIVKLVDEKKDIKAFLNGLGCARVPAI